MPSYYTLEEAARLLGTSAEELKKMAESGEVRPFRDRGTMRFRAPEIEEMARQRGMSSDPDLRLADTPPSRPSNSPTPKKPADDDVFDFELPAGDDDLVEIGQELMLDDGGSRKGPKSSGPKSSGPKSDRSKNKAKTPPPKKGSDSDVRLVPDESDLDFKVSSDSDVKIVQDPSPSSSTNLGKRPKTKNRPDSGVKLVSDTNSDSDVKIVADDHDSNVSLGGSKKKLTSSDSDIRLESAGSSKSKKSKVKIDPREAPDETMLTEEIDLDAELKSAEQQLPKSKSKLKKGGQPKLPKSSPFELSEADLEMPGGDVDSTLAGDSDIELSPALDGSSPLEDDEVSLGEIEAGTGDSGINLKDPADSGISLEQQGSDDEIEMELSLDAGSTPKPSKKSKDSSSDFDLAPEASSPGEDSSASADESEFELSLDDSSGDQEPVKAEDSDSEFELSLDSDAELQPAKDAEDSDSEFELTLDDDSSAEEEAVSDDSGAEDDKDIFETDFEVPALEDDSGSEAVALDDSETDLESSDFDLALDDSDSAPEDESGSQVVALDDEGDVDDAAETVAKGKAKTKTKAKRGGAVLEEDDSGDVEDLFDGADDSDSDSVVIDEDEEEEVAGTKGRAAPAAAVPWGALPALMMLPCVVVLFLVTLMGYEMVRSMQGYKTPLPLTKALVSTFAPDSLPKDTN